MSNRKVSAVGRVCGVLATTRGTSFWPLLSSSFSSSSFMSLFSGGFDAAPVDETGAVSRVCDTWTRIVENVAPGMIVGGHGGGSEILLYLGRDGVVGYCRRTGGGVRT